VHSGPTVEVHSAKSTWVFLVSVANTVARNNTAGIIMGQS